MMFTIGMAVRDDFDGVYFTVQSLRMHCNLDNLIDEIIVVDNNPKSRYGKRIRSFCSNAGDKVRYVPYDAVQGTAAPRNAVFDEAKSEYVVCMDSHCLLPMHSLTSLADYIKAKPYDAKRQILSGPLVYDSLDGACETHFQNAWRAGMWGYWGRAWICPMSGRLVAPGTEKVDGEHKTVWRTVDMKHEVVQGIEIDHFNPTQFLFDNGYRMPFDAFEIPGMGLGVFAAYRENWQRFNSAFRGFGGEEMYIHEKYRRAGGKAICIPGFQWLHRFNDATFLTYRSDRYDTVRNHIIGHRELGMDVDLVRRAFVDGTSFPASLFDRLISDIDAPHPERMQGKEKTGTVQVTDSRPEKSVPADLNVLYEHAKNTVSDINEHCETLRSYASKVHHATEFGVRHGVSSVALLKGVKGKLVSYDKVKQHEVGALERIAPDHFEFKYGDSLQVTIAPTDLLFIDTLHTYGQCYEELKRHHSSVSSYIILHDTVTYGSKGEDGTSKGLQNAIADFVKEHPEWSVIAHYPNNNGLAVLSKLEEEKKALPSKLAQAANYAKAVAKDVSSGRVRVPLEVAEARMMHCMLCPELNKGRCAQCGCPVANKTAWSKEQCPLKKW
jgi:glycosyltransferase involved in cell wall biosynthesis/predicted O-methyltransferase YrrM